MFAARMTMNSNRRLLWAGMHGKFRLAGIAGKMPGNMEVREYILRKVECDVIA